MNIIWIVNMLVDLVPSTDGRNSRNRINTGSEGEEAMQRGKLGRVWVRRL